MALIGSEQARRLIGKHWPFTYFIYLNVWLQSRKRRRGKRRVRLEPNNYWTPEEDKRLDELFHVKQSYKYCAEHMPGRSAEQIKDRVKMRRMYGTFPIPAKPYFQWTPNQERMLVACKRRGLTYAQISEELGIPIKNIDAKCKTMRRNGSGVW